MGNVQFYLQKTFTKFQPNYLGIIHEGRGSKVAKLKSRLRWQILMLIPKGFTSSDQIENESVSYE